MDIQEATRQYAVAHLEGILPALRSEIESMGTYVERRAATLLASDKLTPELAQQLWIEKVQLGALLKRFETRLALGERLDTGKTIDLGG